MTIHFEYDDEGALLAIQIQGNGQIVEVAEFDQQDECLDVAAGLIKRAAQLSRQPHYEA